MPDAFARADASADASVDPSANPHPGASTGVRPAATRPAWAAGVDVTAWCRELRTLVHAGMTVVEALDALRLQGRSAARDRLHGALLGALGRGRRLSDAMADTGAFPPLLLAGVRAGERTSGLIAALDDYLRHAEAMDRLSRQARSAAVYPALVAGLGALIALLLLVVVVPRFAGLYTDAASLSLPTRALLALSGLLVQHGLAGIGWLAVGALGLAAAWRRGGDQGLQGAWRRAVHRAGQWPGVRSGVRDLQRARLYQSLALMYRGGFTLDEALLECRRWSPGATMAAGIGRAVQALQRGRSVSDAMAAGGLTDPVSERLLAVAGRSGEFDRALQTIADRHAQRFGHYLDRVSRLVEPILLLAVAVLVGSMVVLMYMPVFDMAGVLP